MLPETQQACGRNPKPQSQHPDYRYYAGFSPAFVREALSAFDLPSNACVADPWNGSGTTTAVAQALGLQGIGFDINPAAVVIARGRLLGPGVEPSHVSLARQVIATSRSIDYKEHPGPDPLEIWFYPSAAATFRRLERSVYRLLVKGTQVGDPFPVDVHAMSFLAARFYVALFRTVRAFVQPFVPSNPTWVKIPSVPQARLRPEPARVRAEFQRNVRNLFRSKNRRATDAPGTVGPCTVTVASATAIPVQSDTVDAVVASPPYCTRIDYAIATWPELALLGFSKGEFAQLRKTMMGSALVSGDTLPSNDAWGASARDILMAVKRHPSHGSKTYYHKTYSRYFSQLSGSIAEIARVLKADGKCTLVVQDSFYKELHVDLQGVVQEMCADSNLRLVDRRDFPVRRTKLLVNTRSRKYRSGEGATESVLTFARTA